MELLQELFLTAFVAVFFSFLVAKLVSMAMAGDSFDDLNLKLSNKGVDEEVIMEEELQYNQKQQTVQCFGSGNKTEIMSEPVDKVDRFDAENLRLHQISESDEGVEEIETECSELPIIFSSEQATVDETGEIDLETDDVIGETIEVDATAIKLGHESVVIQTSEEAEVAESDKEGKDKEEKEIEIDDEDWEGIEKSELEKAFTAAAKFVETEEKVGRLAHLGSNVEMEMYGLHKIATEGTCREPQPMALKVSARAKWNAWQRLGSMSPEMAMEQYIEHLSEQVPGWIEDNLAHSSKETSEAGMGINISPKTNTFSAHQLEFPTERALEMKPCTEGGGTTGGSKMDNMAKE
ncbi:acyl-CoA-binding domain-containing protein 3-like isoform X2 [Tripterygium wilfordii]|uniref:acyl-CoA-binding domain-containing protein 3-like isoform X2 n=1 Tax=Tripterygium wilfordii TaxID=458696 RepID=UPI0018F7F686|nr:acyl-CoA-binding domain-containing protein 3-like isoform X2 [Tripterygium wilfordii]